MRLPVRPLTPLELSRRLDDGDRRQGLLLYRPACPRCHACEAIRVDVLQFAPTKTQRRIWRRGNEFLHTKVGPPLVSAERVDLYNRHKRERDLTIGNDLLDLMGYEQFLVDSCADTIELSYWDGDRLVGIAVADRASDALSAVYCFFDPDYSRVSPGAYSILKHIALCREWGLRYVYLGLYVATCRSLRYKADYLPHERRIDGEWRQFTRAP
jgi:arginine-tRNA-protein transferase